MNKINSHHVPELPMKFASVLLAGPYNVPNKLCVVQGRGGGGQQQRTAPSLHVAVHRNNNSRHLYCLYQKNRDSHNSSIIFLSCSCP